MATIKGKKGDVPSSVLKALLVTVANSTGRITASRLVMRGPLFTVTEANAVPANQIWQEAREDVRISFLIDGSALNFSSDESPNISDWVELRALNGYRVTDSTAGRDLQDQELDEMV